MGDCEEVVQGAKRDASTREEEASVNSKDNSNIK